MALCIARNQYDAAGVLGRSRRRSDVTLASSVVCVSGTRVSCAKTAEPIEYLPGYRLVVGQKTVRWTGLGSPGEKEHC